MGGGNFQIEFRPVTGYAPPTNRLVGVSVDQVTILHANYINAQPALGYKANEGLRLNGVAGQVYRIDFTTNLTSPTSLWTTLTTTTSINNSQVISGTLPATTGRRFYRAVLVP